MKTKVVYALISGSDDVYTEQLYMSLWSLRHYNEDIETVVLTDPETMIHINYYPDLKNLITKFVIKEFAPENSNIFRSRILKTTIPEMVDGPFIYIDVDTIITASLDHLDSLKAEISLVEDRHVNYYSQTGMIKQILNRSFRYYNRIPKLNAKYYNGGVLFCKNSPIGKEFFKDWHCNWIHYIKKSKNFLDQTALFETTEKYKSQVIPLGHLYNVQVGAYKNPYKNEGKILHFYNSSIGVFYGPLHPFFFKNYYDQIKIDKTLSSKVKEDILKCKELFRYDFYNDKIKFLPIPMIDFYRHFRWKTYYSLIRRFSYYYHVLKLKIGET